jgi:hypothetical protein
VVGASRSSPMASRRARWVPRTRMMVTVIALVCVLCASSRGIVAQTTTQATWPIVKDLERNVVEVGAREGSGDTIIRARGGTFVRTDAVVFETVAYAEYDASGAGAMADVSARLFDMENRVESLRTALKAAENDVPTLTDGVKTCEDGRTALLAEVEALEAAWDSAGARFTPPTCTEPGARNLIYVYDATLGHNVWSCVCKNDYTGTNCEIPPCDTSAFTTLGSCAIANTLAVGAQCDLSCASGSVQDTPLTCTLQGGVGVLNAPLCTSCDSCTNCDGPGKNNFDYTDYTGVNCKIPPCDLSLATSAGVTLRPGEACDQDANGKIKVGATCNIDCGVGTSQVSPLMCSYDSGTDTNYFNSPECTACTGDYTGANCAIAPCDTSAFATLGSCAIANTLAVGAQCDLSCGSNSVQDTPLTCTLQDGAGVLNAPTCTECNLCTDCDGPGKNNFDYTDYSGANCVSPPCDLSLATSAGYTLRAGGTCDLDANGKIVSGTTCDIECAADSIQDSQLVCSYDSSTETNSFNAPTCVPCTGDYTGANCAIAPCDTSAFTTSGTCAISATLAVGGSCDLSCSEDSVQDTPLTCTLQDGAGVLNAPTCTECNLCTDCDGPGKNNFDYTDYMGADCSILSCDLSLATSAGYTFREGGTCASAANGRIPVDETCDIECAAGSVQDSQLTCSYDSSTDTASFNAPTCVPCTGDYTGANCAIAPCDTSAFTTSGTCAISATLAVGGSCDLSCSEGSVQDTPLTCTLQDGAGVLNAPSCTACDSCTDCDGPGKNNFDYTDYSGANCVSPPCDLSLATSAGYTLRVGGTCDLDANGKIISGATCDIECAAGSAQDSQLTCSYDSSSDTASFNAPTCVPCTGNYTGANCATAPCVVGSGASDGSCGAALAVGASCAQYCVEGGKFITSASTCLASGSTISSPGPCRQMDFTVTGYASSFKLSVVAVASGYFNANGDYIGDWASNGAYLFYYTAFKLTVDRDAVYHIGHRLAAGETEYDTSMLIYKDSFDPRDPESNLKYGNDDALNATGYTYVPWFDGAQYNTRPSIFVSLKADTKYVLVMTTYEKDTAIPSTLNLVCGNLDFDGRDSEYAYHDDAELVADTALTRGACALVAYDPDQDD